MKPLNEINNLLPLGPVARRLHVPPKWLRQQVESGLLPGLPAGNTILFDIEIVKGILLERAAKKQSKKPLLGGHHG